MVEDVLGEAFIGPSGRLLDAMLLEVGIALENCYWTNIVLCHPTDEARGPNRQPRAEEVLACMPNVLAIIEKVQPKQVVFVGQLARRYYEKTLVQLPSVRIIHPAALLRGGGRADPRYIIAIRALEELDGRREKKRFTSKAQG